MSALLDKIEWPAPIEIPRFGYGRVEHYHPLGNTSYDQGKIATRELHRQFPDWVETFVPAMIWRGAKIDYNKGHLTAFYGKAQSGEITVKIRDGFDLDTAVKQMHALGTSWSASHEQKEATLSLCMYKWFELVENKEPSNG